MRAPIIVIQVRVGVPRIPYPRPERCVLVKAGSFGDAERLHRYEWPFPLVPRAASSRNILGLATVTFSFVFVN
jgi:hypothetical protein